MKRKPAAFMSYAHIDDKYGHLTEFCKRLSHEVQVLTGEEFPIFQDRNDIQWGQTWEARIEGALYEVTFLIPIITPSFFNSQPCRDELQRFIEHEEELQRDDLILPIYYVDCPLLNDEAKRAKDELAQVIAAHQWADWRDLRSEPWDSQQVRKALEGLAVQIRDALERVRASPKIVMSGLASSIELGESVLKLDADYKPTHYETAAVYKSLRRTLQGLRSPSLASYEHFIAVQDAITLQSCPKLHHGWVLSDVYLRHQTSQFTLPQQYRQIYKKYFDQHFFDKKFMDDKPKIMLTRNPVASVDSPTLVLETQLTRYSYVQFYRDVVAVDSNLRANLLRDTLLGLSGAISFPHSLCMELVVMTKDERILLAKRSPKVAYDPENWSCSVAETFAVEDVTEGGPNSAIRHWIERALGEELGLGTEDYDIANFRILSVFLESDIMNVSLCTLVRVDVDHETLTDIIIAKPRRDYEFTEHDYITFPEMMRELVNPQRRYDTTSRYKMLFSLIHQYGEASFTKHFLAGKKEL